jgi:hypothetical protein
MSSLYAGHTYVHRCDGQKPDHWQPLVCGHCGIPGSGAVIAWHKSGGFMIRWLQCTLCGEPSAQASTGDVFPGALFGPSIEGIPPDVESAYNEARRCLQVNARTACELMCRKILMHVAVDKGAKEGKTFAFYLDHLESAGYMTPPIRQWATLIKDHGNAATHELAEPDEERAKGTLVFTAELLRLIYEMDFHAQRFAPPPTAK